MTLTSEADVKVALRAFWIAEGPGVDPDAFLLWQDDEGVEDHGAIWHRTSIRSAASVGVTVGRTREENRGAVIVEVYAPHADGPGPCERLAAAIAAKWRTFRSAGIVLAAPSTADLTREGAFNRAQVTVGWRADIRPVQT